MKTGRASNKNHVAFCGNSDVTIWEQGEEEPLRREVLRELNAAKGGGMIFQSDHSVTSRVSGVTYNRKPKTCATAKSDNGFSSEAYFRSKLTSLGPAAWTFAVSPDVSGFAYCSGSSDLGASGCVDSPKPGGT